MSRPGGDDTINQGPAGKGPDRDDIEATGNARRKGEDPSPDDRDRGETSSADTPSAIDFEAAHDRAC